MMMCSDVMHESVSGSFRHSEVAHTCQYFAKARLPMLSLLRPVAEKVLLDRARDWQSCIVVSMIKLGWQPFIYSAIGADPNISC